ncbi:allantoinase [Hysterangium stoloniferum]|nr:allantoinase [Hysterangium stoloniferum]
MSRKLVITSNNVQLPDEKDTIAATIEVDLASGKISHISLKKSLREEYQDNDIEFYDFGDLVVLPGLVDAHVHLNEPGRTDWEGFLTGTKAAVAGGFTTVVDMPLNSIPPTTTVPNLDLKRTSAQGQCSSDVAFWGGVIPDNHDSLPSLVEGGVKGFKCFLIESGVEEFPHVCEADVKEAMRILEPLPSVLLFHAELENESPPSGTHDPDVTVYDTFLQSRPDTLEYSAIDLIVSLNKQFPSLRTHIVHLSSATALPLIERAKASQLPLTVETCFHYLCLTSAAIPAGHPEFKCCPPIRSSENREALWNALKDGTIDFVVSDHSPCVASLKCLDSGDIMSAWGGIGGLGLGLSLLWTEGQKRGVNLGDIAQWLSSKPAKHAGLSDRKGAIEAGRDADFVVFDPDAEYTVTEDYLHFKNKVSPYAGMTLAGRVEKTILRGSVVWNRDEGNIDRVPKGILL